MPYYRVDYMIQECDEVYVKASNKKDAIKKAEEIEGMKFADASTERIDKEEYEERVAVDY